MAYEFLFALHSNYDDILYSLKALIFDHSSVCPPVRQLRFGIVCKRNGLTYCHRFFSQYGSPIILVLSASNIFTKFRRGHPLLGCQIQVGIKISRFWTNNSLYLANDTRYRHSYYGVQIGTHMRSIKCYYGGRIGNRT